MTDQELVRDAQGLLRRALPFGLLLIALVCVPVLMFSEAGLPRLRHLRQERARLELERSELEFEIQRLRSEVELIKSDLGAVERAARDELGLVRPSELVFQFEQRR